MKMVLFDFTNKFNALSIYRVDTGSFTGKRHGYFHCFCSESVF